MGVNGMRSEQGPWACMGMRPSARVVRVESLQSSNKNSLSHSLLEVGHGH